MYSSLRLQFSILYMRQQWIVATTTTTTTPIAASAVDYCSAVHILLYSFHLFSSLPFGGIFSTHFYFLINCLLVENTIGQILQAFRHFYRIYEPKIVKHQVSVCILSTILFEWLFIYKRRWILSYIIAIQHDWNLKRSSDKSDRFHWLHFDRRPNYWYWIKWYQLWARIICPDRFRHQTMYYTIRTSPEVDYAAITSMIRQNGV